MNQVHIDSAALLAAKAIKATQGDDRQFVEIVEDGDLSRVFPRGTRCFDIISESSECVHTPRCRWTDAVYLCQERVVVVANRDAPFISLADVIRRLRTGDDALPT
jgi:hypothetical protein